MGNDPTDGLEEALRTLSKDLTRPVPGECLVCFVWRMLDEFGCDGTLRWTGRFRDARAPRATALERRMRGLGAAGDCDVVFDVHAPFAPFWRHEGPLEEDEDSFEVPSCRGARSGSTKPCDLWMAADGRGGFTPPDWFRRLGR